MSQQQLVELTGLKPEVAKQCLDTFGGDFKTALCSVVQTNANLPKEAFDKQGALQDNHLKVNAELTTIYDAVRKVMKETNAAEDAAWKSLRSSAWDVDKAIASAPKSSAPIATAATAASPDKKVIPLKKIDAPKHFTGPLLEMPLFWKEEVEARATLFNMDRGFLAKNRDLIRERQLKWVENTGGFHRDASVQYYEIVDEDEETTRVIIKDVVRTFFHDEHRKKFTNFLFSAFQEFQTYGQPMSFLAGICLLGLNEHETMAVLRKVAKEYIPKHWAPEATGFATNAWLIESIIQKQFPDVAKHFMSLNFWPDTYMQKIISGLTVHVLPFDLMFSFLDTFMAEGFPFLVKFELAIIEHFRSELLAIKDATRMNELYEIMRLDTKAVEPVDMKKILTRAQTMNVEGLDWETLSTHRMRVYDEKIAPRLKAAPKEPEFEPCTLCEKNRPTLWCDDCEEAICKSCHTTGNKSHKTGHSVSDY